MAGLDGLEFPEKVLVHAVQLASAGARRDGQTTDREIAATLADDLQIETALPFREEYFRSQARRSVLETLKGLKLDGLVDLPVQMAGGTIVRPTTSGRDRVKQLTAEMQPATSGPMGISITVESGATVASINTGTVQQLSAAVTNFRESGNVDLARLIEKFTEAVQASKDLSPDTKGEVLEALEDVVQQIELPPADRKLGRVRALLRIVPGLIQAAREVPPVWDQLNQVILPYFPT